MKRKTSKQWTAGESLNRRLVEAAKPRLHAVKDTLSFFATKRDFPAKCLRQRLNMGLVLPYEPPSLGLQSFQKGPVIFVTDVV